MKLWGSTPQGNAYLFYLTLPDGVQVTLSNLGATLLGWTVPDNDGNLEDIVLGTDIAGHLSADTPYFGSTIGRYANRIAGGRLSLDGKEYQLSQNSGQNTLHGGFSGFNQALWTIWEDHSQESCPSITFYLQSPDGDQGFPGTLQVWVRYTLEQREQNYILRLDYWARSDKTTVINLTNHAYWNLSAESQTTIVKHLLKVNADFYTPTDTTGIPTGKQEPIDSFIDMRQWQEIETIIRSGQVLDHNFVLNSSMPAAQLYSPASRRLLSIYTSEPGLQVYTGNFLDGRYMGKCGLPYQRFSGICLETQHFPDSPNQVKFPSTRLEAGDLWHSETSYCIECAGNII